MDKSHDQIIAEGQWASALLNDGTYNAVFKDYTDAMLATIVQSDPHETKKREYEYAKLRALIEFNAHLAGLAKYAHDLINASDALEDTD